MEKCRTGPGFTNAIEPGTMRPRTSRLLEGTLLIPWCTQLWLLIGIDCNPCRCPLLQRGRAAFSVDGHAMVLCTSSCL